MDWHKRALHIFESRPSNNYNIVDFMVQIAQEAEQYGRMEALRNYSSVITQPGVESGSGQPHRYAHADCGTLGCVDCNWRGYYDKRDPVRVEDPKEGK